MLAMVPNATLETVWTSPTLTERFGAEREKSTLRSKKHGENRSVMTLGTQFAETETLINKAIGRYIASDKQRQTDKQADINTTYNPRLLLETH